jgi:O-antigen ligase
MHAHQVFLEVLTELGVVGLLLFVGVLFLVLRETVCFCRNEREGARRAVGVSLIATLTGGLVMGAFDSLWYHHGLYWLFWSVVALLVNVMQEGSNEQPLRE